MDEKQLLVTICGRAGSKGFKNKNLKTFCGRQLVYYTISAIELFKQQHPEVKADVVLNTDSIALEGLCSNYMPEIEIVHRPPRLGGDSVPKMAVFQHSLAVMEERKEKQYDYLMDLDITSPLRTDVDAWGCYETMLNRNDIDVVFSAVKSRRNPYMNMAQRVEDHVEQVIKTQFVARQQTPLCFDLNASIYVFKREFLVQNQTGFLWDGKCEMYEMEDTAVLDIDSEEDFDMMEVVARHLYATRPEFAAVRENIR